MAIAAGGIGGLVSALAMTAAAAPGELPVVSTVPLCPGLQIVTAISEPDGDYESIKTVEAAGDTDVRIRYSSERMVTDLFSGDPPTLTQNTVYRNVRREDLRTAKLYHQQFYDKLPETIPETTAIGASAAVLDALKSAGEAEIGVFIAYSGEASLDRNVHPNVYDNQMIATVRRVGAQPVLMPVIVNDTLSALPAIHAEGDFFGDKSEFFFLDDPQNPMTLKFRIGIGAILPLSEDMRALCEAAGAEVAAAFGSSCANTEGGDRDVLQVVKISQRCGAPAAASTGSGGAGMPGAGQAPDPGGLSGSAAALEAALAESGKVEVYDIYFTYDSAEIRKESEPRLEEIAAVLAKHPDWKLTVTGHTDGIASDTYNLGLSARRADAVKEALVARHGIDGNRLLTSGAGESQPKDTNETLEGRARNRRVELVRL